jgi:hypothetical protein
LSIQYSEAVSSGTLKPIKINASMAMGEFIWMIVLGLISPLTDNRSCDQEAFCTANTLAFAIVLGEYRLGTPRRL